MNVELPIEVAKEYSSPAQRIRVMREHWVNRSVTIKEEQEAEFEGVGVWAIILLSC